MDPSENEQYGVYKRAAQFFGSIGGKTTSQLYGKEHYQRIGRKGMQKRWGERKNTTGNKHTEI